MAITFIAVTANILQMGVVTNIFKSIALLPPTLSADLHHRHADPRAVRAFWAAVDLYEAAGDAHIV